MTERKYSISEIDMMRQAVEDRWLFGAGAGCLLMAGETTHRTSRSYNENDKVTQVEQILRTYMLAGIDPADLHREVYGTTDADPNSSSASVLPSPDDPDPPTSPSPADGTP